MSDKFIELLGYGLSSAMALLLIVHLIIANLNGLWG